MFYFVCEYFRNVFSRKFLMKKQILLSFAVIALLLSPSINAFVPEDFAIKVESQVTVTSPPKITLLFARVGSTSDYTIRRKGKTEAQWNTITPTPVITDTGTDFKYDDTNVTLG